MTEYTYSLNECLRDVSFLVGYQWNKYQSYLVEEGKQKNHWLDYDSYFRQMSFSWYVWYGSYHLRINTPDIDLLAHGLSGSFGMKVSLNFKDPYVYVWGKDGISDKAIKEIEQRIRRFFPGINRGAHFEPCHWCEEFRLCEKLEELWICSSCKSEQDKDEKETEGYVYIFGSIEDGYYKIGASKIPESRLAYYGTRLPFEVEMIHLIAVDDKYTAEKQLHSKFADKRKKREWFLLSDDDLAFVKSLCKYQEGRWATIKGETVWS